MGLMVLAKRLLGRARNCVVGESKRDTNISPVELKQEHVLGARLYANRIDAIDMWPRGGCVAEIGVALGDFSQVIIEKVQPELFDAYDTFHMHHIENIWGRPSEYYFKGLTHKEFYQQRFSGLMSSGGVRLFEGDGATEISGRDSQFYDVIYIDAGHLYEDVLRDARSAIPKLKSDGLLVFNDYTLYDPFLEVSYGVVQVVNELCASGDWRLVYFALEKNMFCDVALIRNK